MFYDYYNLKILRLALSKKNKKYTNSKGKGNRDIYRLNMVQFIPFKALVWWILCHAVDKVIMPVYMFRVKCINL